MTQECKCCGRTQDTRMGYCFDCVEAESIIETYSSYWMEIVGTRGFKGKKTLNARTQFNALFDMVDEPEVIPVKSEHSEDFSSDEMANLDRLENEQT